MSEWKKICLVDDIPVLGSRRVRRPQGMDVAVFRNSEDQVFALLDRCPPKAGPGAASAGAIGDATFDVQTPHSA